MSKWGEIRRGAKKIACKAISKTSDLSDTASLKVKLGRKQAFLRSLTRKQKPEQTLTIN